MTDEDGDENPAVADRRYNPEYAAPMGLDSVLQLDSTKMPRRRRWGKRQRAAAVQDDKRLPNRLEIRASFWSAPVFWRFEMKRGTGMAREPADRKCLRYVPGTPAMCAHFGDGRRGQRAFEFRNAAH